MPNPINLDELQEAIELRRVNLQFNGGSNIGIVFFVNGHYYDIKSVSPAFRPMSEDSVLTRPQQFSSTLEARHTRMIERHTAQAFGYQTLEESLEMFLLDQLHPMKPGEELEISTAWLYIKMLRGNPPQLLDDPTDNLTLFHWQMAFATAWRSLETRLQEQ